MQNKTTPLSECVYIYMWKLGRYTFKIYIYTFSTVLIQCQSNGIVDYAILTIDMEISKPTKDNHGMNMKASCFLIGHQQ